MKKLLSLALIAITLFACSEQEELNNSSSNAGKTSLSVKIDLSKFKTRSGDEIINDIPEWTHLLLVAKKDSEVREKLIAKDDLAINGVVQLFEKDPTNFAGGTVKAYIITPGNDWGNITALSTVNLPTLAIDQKDINEWQPTGFIREGIAGKFVNVPYYGSSEILDGGPGGDGHHQLTATVSVTPELGRIQVLGSPKPGGKKNNYTVTSITVKNIYINRIESKEATIDARTLNSGANVATDDQWVKDFYVTGKPLVGMTGSGTNRGYQIFDGSKPHVIVEVEYQLSNDTTKYKGYLTLQKFNYDEKSGDLIVAKGKIYNIDLSSLQPTYDQIGDDPYDNTIYHDLNVIVTVKTWSFVPVTPEL